MESGQGIQTVGADSYYQNQVRLKQDIENATVESNIDRKIESHEREIERLRRVKEQMPSELLRMRISDLSEAMRF